jgi:hypothetical protein
MRRTAAPKAHAPPCRGAPAVSGALGALRHALLLFATAATLAACGGGGGGDTATVAAVADVPGTPSIAAPAVAGSNVVAVRVDRGIDNSAINQPFVTVTVCQPGSNSCVDVDHVLVDTGSSGLRIAASALPPDWRLPQVTAPSGVPLGECAQFASGFSWGAVRRADVRLGGERAANLPVQVVGDPAQGFGQVPAACSATGAEIGAGRGARGILGIGLFNNDCGEACEVSTAPGVYYACDAAGCTGTRAPIASQVTNPVSRFAVNNNGVALVLPPLPLGGTAEASGSLIFGVGTQSNNQLGNARVYNTDARGRYTVVYKGVSYPNSFLDSGSNGIFLRDSSLPLCGDFYCPATALSLTATTISATGVSGTVSFQVEAVSALRPDAAAGHLAGPFGALVRTVDFGLPFFFGRTVFVARSGAPTPAGPGPYWAY